MNTNNDITVHINICNKGLYSGLNKHITIISKMIIAALVIWAVIFPDNAAAVLGNIRNAMLDILNYYYVYVVSLFLIFCLSMVFLPVGKTRLGAPDSTPDFSNFSWFSMMFGAGIGIGIMFYCIGEPMHHFTENPHIIKGLVEPASANTISSAMRYTLLHWGLHPWSTYVVVGLAMAYFSYQRGLPLTVRSTLMPLFGEKLNGPLGHIIDIVAIVATVLGIAMTVGIGVVQLISGFNDFSHISWLMNTDGKPTTVAIIVVLLLVMVLSTISALTGVGRGIKWLSNINTLLSIMLMLVFCIAGSTIFALSLYFESLFDYLIHLPRLSFTVWDASSSLGEWQNSWTILYWPWWIAFAPFVGVFLARVSKGRTVREFVIGAMLVPTLISFIWFALMGGTALNLEINGISDGAILAAPIESKLFVVLQQMLDSDLAHAVSIIVVLLIFTFLITSVDSGVLVLNTIMAGGSIYPAAKHRVIWGGILTLMIGALMFAGGLGAIENAMIIGALPFSVIILLMCISVLKSAFKR